MGPLVDISGVPNIVEEAVKHKLLQRLIDEVR